MNSHHDQVGAATGYGLQYALRRLAELYSVITLDTVLLRDDLAQAFRIKNI
jgi:hypothetical protein